MQTTLAEGKCEDEGNKLLRVKNEMESPKNTGDNSEKYSNHSQIWLIVMIVVVLISTLAIVIVLFLIMASLGQLLTTNQQANQVAPIATASLISGSDIKSDETQLKKAQTFDTPALQKSVITMSSAPKDQLVRLGEAATLNCGFSEPVQCSWKRNNQFISIRDRYFFQLQRNTNEVNTNCSIVITNVTTIDFTVWTCEMKSTDNDNPQKIPSADAYITEDKSPQPVRAKLGSDVTLECEFERTTQCVWLKNDNPVNIAGRYKFVNNQDSETKKCSFIISKVNINDYANWTCVSPADSNRQEAISNTPIVLANAA